MVKLDGFFCLCMYALRTYCCIVRKQAVYDSTGIAPLQTGAPNGLFR